MKNICITLILVLIAPFIYAQKEGNIWYFGQHCGLDFNQGAPIPLTNGALSTNEGCSSICDSVGNLLFYTDGITIWNRNHLPMPNGTGLTGNQTSTQSVMIIKKPGSQNIYYVYSLFTDFCYSVVDMSLDFGLGDVTEAKNVMIFKDANSEKQCATHHANGIDVWVTLNSINSFHSYLLTPTGFNLSPVTSTVGTVSGYGPGQMQFSPQGNKLAFGIICVTAGSPNIVLLDFNNVTGTVSNNIDISNGSPQCYGIEFSPDGSKLYATGNTGFTLNVIYQYDVNASSTAAIVASQIMVGQAVAPNVTVTGLEIGPDLKIYISRRTRKFLAVINNPNLLGLSCNYVDSTLYLGSGICLHGLPHLISDYWTSPVSSSTLDLKDKFSIFPNPATEYLYIESKLSFHNNKVAFYDIAGRKYLEMIINSTLQKIDISKLPKGYYIIKHINESENIFGKILIR